MKKFLILLAVILFSQSVQAAISANLSILDKIENSLYGYTYSNESETNRLNRIETKVYGQTSNAQPQARIAKLKKDLSADLIGHEITPTEDTFREPEDSIIAEKEPPEAANMDYPMINELEKSVFNKEFKTQNLKTRLTNLETKTFGKTYENEDLSTRVDRLKAEIKPKSFLGNEMAKQENSFYNGDINRMAENYHLDSYGADDTFDYDSYNNFNSKRYSSFDDYPNGSNVFKPSKQLNISAIEKTLYKTRYDNEPMATRLARIESSIFGSIFASDSEGERLARISSAINAQKSAKRYDSNKFGQNMATAFQIGTLILMVLACIL